MFTLSTAAPVITTERERERERESCLIMMNIYKQDHACGSYRRSKISYVLHCQPQFKHQFFTVGSHADLQRNLCVLLYKSSNTTVLSYLLVHRTNIYMFRPCMWAETCSCQSYVLINKIIQLCQTTCIIIHKDSFVIEPTQRG